VQQVADKLANLAKPGVMRSIWPSLKDFLTVDPVPKLACAANWLAGTAVEHASALTAAPKTVDNLLSSIIPDSYRNPEEMAKTIDILNKVNIPAVWDEFHRRTRYPRARAARKTSGNRDGCWRYPWDAFAYSRLARVIGG
jgi:hypothetical protein